MSAYASHINNLQDKTEVLASEDIMSDQGVLLAKSGTTLNQQTCQNILKFKLLKPLEDSIFIENQLTSKQIFQQIIDIVNRDFYLKSLNTKINKNGALQKCCKKLDEYPLLLQKLTVLDMELTDVFRQSLLSGYFACLCGVLENYKQDKVEENFLAGITHDIGYLHIDRQILLKQETLNAEEWKKVQSHPVIAYEILKRIPKFPKSSARAVLEHHENLDGSGYPRARTVHELGGMGQLINLLDNVIVIYQKKFKPLKRSPNGVLPIIQINMHSYLPNVVSTIFKLLKMIPPSTAETSDEEIIRELIHYVQQKQHYIKTITNAIQQANDTIGFTHQKKTLYALQNTAINILVIMNSSGLGSDSIDWVEQLDRHEDQQALYSEVEDTRLMQGELIFQLQSYQKSANVFINQYPDDSATQELKAALDAFAKNARPTEPDKLKEHWQQLAAKKA
ncbi:MAG: HD-GYP domain-containing protein [Cellvibrionaceae bacterium]